MMTMYMPTESNPWACITRHHASVLPHALKSRMSFANFISRWKGLSIPDDRKIGSAHIFGTFLASCGGSVIIVVAAWTWDRLHVISALLDIGILY